MGVQTLTLNDHATDISMPLHEHKELLMSLGTGNTQATMAFDPGIQYNRNIYKIKTIQRYYIQDNYTMRIVVHGNLSPIYVEADAFPPFAMTNDILVPPCSKACLPCYAYHDLPQRQSI